MLYTKFNFHRPVCFGENPYWPSVETFQFLIRPEFPVSLLTFSDFVLFMLGNLINIMQVKIKIIIINIWRHYDIHIFSQNLHYAIRCLLWRKQNHANVLLEDRRKNATLIFLKCVLYARPLMT